MLFTSMKPVGLLSVLVVAAGLGCRGDGSYGSSGCHSCQNEPVPVDVQTTYAAPADSPLHSRGRRGGSGSSGCNSCRSDSIPADVQAAYEVPAERQLPSNLGLATTLERSSSPALAQRTCPVTGAELGSMGPPVPVSVAGRTIEVCCGGCREKVMQNPELYLARMERETGGAP